MTRELEHKPALTGRLYPLFMRFGWYGMAARSVARHAWSQDEIDATDELLSLAKHTLWESKKNIARKARNKVAGNLESSFSYNRDMAILSIPSKGSGEENTFQQMLDINIKTASRLRSEAAQIREGIMAPWVK